MPEHTKKPAIRFKGFTDDWEQRKLGEISSEIGDGLHSAPTYDDNGTYYFINGNNLDSGKIKVDLNETPKVSSFTFMQNDKKLDSSTILLSINGTIGNLAYYKGEPVMLGKSAAYLKIRYANKSFIYTALQTSNIMEKFTLSLTGTTIKNLGLDAIKNTIFLIPNQREQEKIAKLFTNLDHLITLHQRKYDKLVNIKKAMLEKMFPKDGAKTPEIRFKGFTDDWEQRKLGECCIEFKSGDTIKAEKILANGKFPVFGGNGLRGYTNQYNHDGEYALIGRQGALCGNMNYSCGKAYFTEHAVAVSANNDFKTRYLYYSLGKMNLGQYSGQSAQPGLAVNRLIELKNIFPRKKEQEKIAKLFTNLDQLITLHQRKLEKLQNIKKACLEKMFV